MRSTGRPSTAGTPKSPGTHASSPVFRLTCNDFNEPPKLDGMADIPKGGLIERWSAELQRRSMERGVFCSLDDLTTALEDLDQDADRARRRTHSGR
jgi:hypothetical protein